MTAQSSTAMHMPAILFTMRRPLVSPGVHEALTSSRAHHLKTIPERVCLPGFRFDGVSSAKNPPSHNITFGAF